MLHRACEATDIAEGTSTEVTIERKRWLIVWPTGGTPRAFRALCPDQEASLSGAPFDGRVLTCPHHGWRFDGETGACVSGQRCDPIKQAPMTIVDGAVYVDVPEKKRRAAD